MWGLRGVFRGVRVRVPGRLGRVSHLSTHVPATSLPLSPELLAAFKKSTPESEHILRSFSQPRNGAQGALSGEISGLFQIPALTIGPSGLHRLVRETLPHAQQLASEICAAKTDKELFGIVRTFDRLSDALCRVLDLCEFIRGAHPDASYVAASEEVYGELFSYMNVLNTHVGLYEALKRLEARTTVWRALSEEERVVARIFLRDFYKSGIQLSERKRERFIELSDDVQMLSRKFLLGQENPKRPTITLPEAVLPNYPFPGVSRRGGQVRIQVNPRSSHALLQHCTSEEGREAIYRAAYAAPDGEVEVLDRLVERRHELARCVGYASYGDMFLSDKMAKTPQYVQDFVSALAARNKSDVEGDIGQLNAFRVREAMEKGKGMSRGPLQVWDKPYYHRMLQASEPALPSLAPFLRMGRVVAGLSRLMEVLYGQWLRPVEHARGEVWAEGVRKMEVVDEGGAVRGLIYLDLLHRPGKARGAAHYTIRCSRRVWPEEGGASVGGRAAGEVVRRGDGDWVVPMVVLTCGFEGGDAGMDLSEVETLFHEAGHAFHAMLGQTAFHNVAGTRCAVDFVELPSIVHERFINEASFVQLLTADPVTGAPAPMDLIRAHLQYRLGLSGLEDQQQMVYSMLDQQLHAGEGVGSDEVVRRVERQVGAFPHAEGARWQLDFGHLVGYGGGYYSYLLDRVLANRVWSRLFYRDGVSRATGERLAGSVLRQGGSRDPWACVEELLEEECTMRVVGTWGLHGEA